MQTKTRHNKVKNVYEQGVMDSILQSEGAQAPECERGRECIGLSRWTDLGTGGYRNPERQITPTEVLTPICQRVDGKPAYRCTVALMS